MEKLSMRTLSMADRNYTLLKGLFPNAITEIVDDNGNIVRAIDADVLSQEMNTYVVSGNEERYQFTWPDKKKSILLANAPIAKTLRPCREESVDFDNTENLYIEGDNLEVLKLLQETYLGKVKIIYIDPPYNTGNDFVYEDDFAQNTEEYFENSGQFDEEGNRLVQNTESNGRFHTDWLNMMYPRLKLARDLLSDDGVIFISIDDNEVTNLNKICNEIFGADNCIGPIIQNKQNAKNDTLNIQKNHEFILVYRKQCQLFDGAKVIPTLIREIITYKDVLYEDGLYYFLNDPITTRGEGGTLNARPNLGYTVYYNPDTKDKIAIADYDITLARTCNDIEKLYNDNDELISQGYIAIRPPMVRGKLGCWTWSIDKFNQNKIDLVIIEQSKSYSVRKRSFVKKDDLVVIDGKHKYAAKSIANSRSIIDFSTNDGTNTLNSLLELPGIFNNPKNLNMIKYLLGLYNNTDCIVMDFFSGSSTTAHAVMQLNAEDDGKRKFVMVQLPEETDEKSEAYKAKYKNICEIGKERIRRVGRKIKEDNKEKGEIEKLDIGFRVLKVDSTNMKDVYYNPGEYNLNLFDDLTDNIKEDRSPLDLLFQVLIEMDVLLSSNIVETEICGKKVFSVMDDYLIACFDKGITSEVVEAIAKKEPYYAVFRDSCMANDSTMTNFDQIFETYSQDTIRKVL